jgi:uncharacterized protein (TIGR02391 family)
MGLERYIKKIQEYNSYITALTEEVRDYPDEILLDESTIFIGTDLSSYWQLCHPTITKVSKKKFEDGHYADSVETAFKEINSQIKLIVKSKTGNEYDGSDLMNHAFSINNPLIVLDDLLTEDGQNIQKGFMQIFAGSMTGIRNPKAHSIITISPERAIHFLILASLLLSKLDESRG